MEEHLYLNRGMKIFTVILILLPILNQYKIFPLLVMDTIAMIGILYFFVKGHRSIKKNIIMIFYIVYIIVNTLVWSTTLQGVTLAGIFVRMARVLVLYFFFFFMSSENFNFTFGFRVYTKIVYAVSILVIVQYAIYFITGMDISFLIPHVPLNYGSYETSSDLMHAWHVTASVGVFRPCSFFLEPAYQAQYCLPWLAIAIFTEDKCMGKRPVWGQILVTIGICLTTSSIGILGCAILWIYYIVSSSLSKNNRQARKMLIIIPFLCIVVAFILTQSNISMQLLGRLAAIGSESGGSTTVRLFRGIACFRKMDIIHQLFGCGYGNLEQFLTQNAISTIYDEGLEVIDYMNAASTLLCSMGIVGAFLYLLAIGKFAFRNLNKRKISLLIALMILMCTSALFDAPIYFLIMLLLQYIDTIKPSEEPLR